MENYCLEEILKNIGVTRKVKFTKECYKFITETASNSVDLNLSSGIRESYRILEKIILQINKDILLEKWKNDEKVINITFEIFNKYFENLNYGFLKTKNDTSHMTMYI